MTPPSPHAAGPPDCPPARPRRQVVGGLVWAGPAVTLAAAAPHAAASPAGQVPDLTPSITFDGSATGTATLGDGTWTNIEYQVTNVGAAATVTGQPITLHIEPLPTELPTFGSAPSDSSGLWTIVPSPMGGFDATYNGVLPPGGTTPSITWSAMASNGSPSAVTVQVTASVVHGGGETNITNNDASRDVMIEAIMIPSEEIALGMSVAPAADLVCPPAEDPQRIRIDVTVDNPNPDPISGNANINVSVQTTGALEVDPASNATFLVSSVTPPNGSTITQISVTGGVLIQPGDSVTCTFWFIPGAASGPPPATSATASASSTFDGWSQSGTQIYGSAAGASFSVTWCPLAP